MTPRPPERAPVLLKAANGLLAIAAAALVPMILWEKTAPEGFGVLREASPIVFACGFVGAVLLSLGLRAADIARGRGWRPYGAWSFFPGVAAVLVLCAGVIFAGRFLRSKPDINDDQAAHQAGARAEAAMQRYHVEHHRYTKNIGELLELDPTILETPEVTFTFDQADESGYRYSTHHAGSRTTYRFSSHGVVLFEKSLRRKQADPPP